MEKNISKKLVAGICALSAAFILASCDPISAVPKNYNDPIVVNKDTKAAIEDDNNKVGKIYDSIATDRNTKIVSTLLENVALGKFGSFIDLKTAYEGDEAAKEKYISDHASVLVRKGDKDVKGFNEKQVQLARFDNLYKDIMARINEFFYNEVTSGSYNDDEGRFDEGKLWMAHYYEFYDLGNRDEAMKNVRFVTNDITKENAYNELKGKYYLTAEEAKAGKRGYIEEKVYPQILKDKLVEEYVLNNNYASLGRAYAREVNYIKISYETDIFAWDLLKNFAEDYIIHSTDALDFEIITKAIKGFDSVKDFQLDPANPSDIYRGIVKLADGSPAKELLKKTLKETDKVVEVKAEDISKHYMLDNVALIEADTYYRDTKLGELIYSYQKAIRAEEAGRFPIASDKAELDKFTSSGKSKEYGLREKLISLAKEDYTTEGWYVKNGGLSELPSALRDRLFNINVASKLDDGSLADEHPASEGKEDTMGSYENGSKRLPYLRSINGRKFVIPAKSQTYAENPYNYLYQDVDGKAFYIVQVLEAPSTAKLNTAADSTYDGIKAEKLARSVAKVLGTKDSYIKDAYTEELRPYTFTFYETSLYEHFKSEYPDLFEEEK